jgi:hypothetical protein
VAEDRLAGSPAVWSVVCDDYTTEQATLAEAEQMAGEIAGLVATGHVMTCRLSHVLSNDAGQIILR